MPVFIDQIKDHIQLHIDNADENATLKQWLQQRQGQLHDAISISSATPVESLAEFSQNYIRSLPEHIEAFYSLSEEAGTHDYVQPFLNFIYTCFIKPLDSIQALPCLQGMLHKAYLSHRILEEVNDQVINLTGVALAPLDMSMANLIAHDLIGEDSANSLDHLVLMSLETTDTDPSTFDRRDVRRFMQERKLKGWEDVLQRWPCFTKDLSVELAIGV